MDPVDIADGLCAVTPPRGRFEFVDIGQSFRIAVDYAHTPDALAAALLAARQVAADGKVSLVFGCGGDRDQQKRPEMGRIAVEGADRVYVTSDNPRSENPERIIADVVAGIPGAGSHPAVIVDVSRRSAIRRAIVEAESGDIVLIAGKGHEVDQVIGDQTLPFDDREIAIEALGQRS
jgi:UDP-N-acetylmuramoyl-L-alanyl-D-glutamate--2,6-diaminopimelate ligase